MLAAGKTRSGCTVHQVTEEVDSGPIVVQEEVEVAPDETPESLKAKARMVDMLRSYFIQWSERNQYLDEACGFHVAYTSDSYFFGGGRDQYLDGVSSFRAAGIPRV